MFSFFKKKPPTEITALPPVPLAVPEAPPASAPVHAPAPATEPSIDNIAAIQPAVAPVAKSMFSPSTWFGSKPARPVDVPPEQKSPEPIAVSPKAVPANDIAEVPAFLRNLPAAPVLVPVPAPAPVPVQPQKISPYRAAPAPVVDTTPERASWFTKLKTGLRKTGTGITAVFVNAKIDDALYEELETALLMADTGVKATEFLLEDLRRRVKSSMATEASQVRVLLADALTDLLKPLEKQLVIGEHTPTVIMVAGVNGAGKTTSIGKLTRHLSSEGCSVLLAAADTFRAAAREQLLVWADRNTVDIVSNEGGDPAAVAFDAVNAGKARGRDVVLVDTAGRLPTQLHLMDELKKIKRVVGKADSTAPHEVLLVIDGNTGQNAVTQVKAFDDILGLTGLIVTKLDGTAKGGVLAAIARERPIPVYFVGVGEKLEDLETFSAREFAQALLG